MPTQFHTLPATNCRIIAGEKPGYLSLATSLGQDYMDDDDGLGILWFMSAFPVPSTALGHHRIRLGFSSPSTDFLLHFFLLSFFFLAASKPLGQTGLRPFDKWVLHIFNSELWVLPLFPLDPKPYLTHFVFQSVSRKANWSGIGFCSDDMVFFIRAVKVLLHSLIGINTFPQHLIKCYTNLRWLGLHSCKKPS